MTTRIAPTVAVLLALAIAGCGSSGSSSSSDTSSTTTSSSAAQSGGGYGNSGATTAKSTSASAGGGVTIKAAGFAFAPKSVTVKKGQKVTWTNSDPASHNVTSSDGTIKSKDFAQGGSFTYTATKAGTFDYICTIHPQMKATLIVTG
jgi:plastocyanin